VAPDLGGLPPDPAQRQAPDLAMTATRAGLDRIVRKIGDPDIVRKLAFELTAPDLTTLLLEIAAERASRARASDVLARYQTDRFTRPSTVSFRHLRSVEDTFIRAVPDVFDWVVPSPVLPLGAHAALGPVSQDWVVSTVRPNEVAADPTVALALEAALRRHETPARRSLGSVRLATIQRITRAQRYESPDAFVHFSIFAMVTAGRSQAGEQFDDEALGEHLGVYVDAMTGIADRVELVLSTAETSVGRRLRDGIHDRWTSSFVTVSDDSERLGAQRYYRRACFKIQAVTRREKVEVVDGGFTDWTDQLLGDRHERLLISGAGLDRPALTLGEGRASEPSR
jgi:hypothetical protein